VGKTFVGFGFGPIQSGLFLFEAYASRNFERFVVAEVVPDVVSSVRGNGGTMHVNVAGRQGISTHELEGIEICNPRDPADAALLIEAIARADEIATALPSVDFYCRGTPTPTELLARGIERKLDDETLPRAIVYAAENHNHAAELLRDAVTTMLNPAVRTRLDERVQFINTVIGKMSGVVNDPFEIARDNLVPLVPGSSSAVLVEEFNRILISEIRLPAFHRGIEVFAEKPDLLPFEEAKLYGHNAAHALLGYLAHQTGLTLICETESSELLNFVERAFIEESGAALCRRHAGVDRLFTPDGWSFYAHDLLVRMVNPYLHDRVDRVIRDPKRKLGWDDRLVGTMRVVRDNGILPRRYALGAAAALNLLTADVPPHHGTSLLDEIWKESLGSTEERNAIVELIQQAQVQLQQTTNFH